MGVRKKESPHSPEQQHAQCSNEHVWRRINPHAAFPVMSITPPGEATFIGKRFAITARRFVPFASEIIEPPRVAGVCSAKYRFAINLSELLRLIQFFNSGGYHACPDEIPPTEDGYRPGVVGKL